MDGMERRLASTVSLSTRFCRDWMFVKSSGIFFMLERRLDKSNESSSGGSSRQVFQYRWVRTGIGKDSRPVVVNGGATTSLPWALRRRPRRAALFPVAIKRTVAFSGGLFSTII